MSWYVIKGLSPAFDGLLVEGVEGFSFINIDKIVNRSIMFGDRELSYSLPHGSMSIDVCYLEPIEDPTFMQFDSKSPMGKFMEEGSVSKPPIKIAWARYEKALTVNIREESKEQAAKTLFSGNYNNPVYFHLIKESVLNADVIEDLIFELADYLEHNIKYE